MIYLKEKENSYLNMIFFKKIICIINKLLNNCKYKFVNKQKNKIWNMRKNFNK